MFKTPSFWYHKKSHPLPLRAILLQPFSAIYKFGYMIDQARKTPRSVDIPVICVGNLIAGGAGKTITAQSLMRLLQEHTLSPNPFFVSRGYGGHLKDPTRIDPAQHTYTDCGDEPLLLSNIAPTIISKNRYWGAKRAQDESASCVILDDGLQNKDLERDINFVIIDAAMGLAIKSSSRQAP